MKLHLDTRSNIEAGNNQDIVVENMETESHILDNIPHSMVANSHSMAAHSYNNQGMSNTIPNLQDFRPEPTLLPL